MTDLWCYKKSFIEAAIQIELCGSIFMQVSLLLPARNRENFSQVFIIKCYEKKSKYFCFFREKTVGASL